ncbi:MAG: CHAD domain-containing protein [Acidimicrobiia bacterium]
MIPATEHRFLPAVPAGFVLGETESLPGGLRRITLEQFDRSIDRLESGVELDRAVHETRKSIKRLRATLRLVSGEIGTKVYRAENGLLRDTSRLLAPIRDGWVMVDAVARLRSEFSSQLAPTAFAHIEEALTDRHERRRQRTLADENLFPVVVTTLRAARQRYAAWPVESGSERTGTRRIRDTFEAIEPGLRNTYARGRAEMDHAAAEPVEEHFHQWRKRVKYLRHQMEILEPLWPEVVSAHAATLDQLGELLGDEHDLAVLLQLLADIPSLATDGAERAMLAALAQHRRRELQRAALTVGMRVYAESPGRFVDRMGTYWDSRLITLDPPF